MADPMYSSDFLLDPSQGIKLEPGMDALITSASVPIPSRRLQDPDFGYELTSDPFNISSPLVSNDNTFDMNYSSDINIWGRDARLETFRMDEEDIFQVDKSDLIQGPTLAELNANEDQLLTGDLTFDGLMLPGEGFNVPSVTMLHVETSPTCLSEEAPSPMLSQSHLGVSTSFLPASFPPAGVGHFKDSSGVSSSMPTSPMDGYIPNPVCALSPSSQHSSGSSPAANRHSTLHELLMRREPFGCSVSPASPPLRTMARPRPSSRLSSSAPTHLGHDQIWQRREPRQHLLSTGSLAEGESISSLSTLGVLSPESHLSQDDGSDSEDESDRLEFDEQSSDGGTFFFLCYKAIEYDTLKHVLYFQFQICCLLDSSDGEGRERRSRHSAKKERFFWQYNVQAKGPKGQRLVLKTKQEDPHFLNEVKGYSLTLSSIG